MIVWTVTVQIEGEDADVIGVYSTRLKAVDEAGNYYGLPDPIVDVTEKGDYIAEVLTYTVDNAIIVVESHRLDDQP